ncbi:Fatty acid desaturase [Enhydrobacter aerosaccus]|uniref:Fatty acid desaturase n=1 Tax=Enhydrobacter aerosaccus TaxID=225324 RepID=A0A1T4QLU9_9HYPH|nr:fatty acid desaturase [Enhydrobacter aerosaccus]SKA04750.1 Fatty acid desaturase [Enhydrobacter aerosaccus]
MGTAEVASSSFVVTGARARQMRVVPAPVLKRLYARSDVAGALQTAAHLVLLVAGGWLVWATRGTWWVLPALVMQGLFINALFAAMHESVHYGSFKTRWMADLLAFFSGAAILNNAGYYRHYHMAHHRYTQDPARDPELLSAPAPTRWGQYLWRVSSIPFLVLRLRDVFLFPFGYRGGITYIHEQAWPEVRRWGRWLLVFYALLLAGSLALHTTLLLWVWLLPLLVGLPFLRLYLVCEHTLCPHSDDGFANTRTTLSNPLVRFLMWNLPYHAEHHLFPNIAFHHLPEAHTYLRPHLKHVAKGYIQVQAEILRSLA